MRKRSEVRIVKRGDQYLILDKDDDTVVPRKGFVSDETRAKISESNKGKKVNIVSMVVRMVKILFMISLS